MLAHVERFVVGGRPGPRTRQRAGSAAVAERIAVKRVGWFTAAVLAASVLASLPAWPQAPAQVKAAPAPRIGAPAKPIGLDLADLKVQDLWIESNGQRVTRPLVLGEKYLLVCQWAAVGLPSTATFKIGYTVDGRLVASRSVPAASPTLGRQATKAGVAYAPDRAGKHRYECVLDYDHTVHERDTANNRASLPFDVAAKMETAVARRPAAGLVPPLLRQGPPFAVTLQALTVTGKSPVIATPVAGFTPVAVTLQSLTVTGKVFTPGPAAPFTPVVVTLQPLTVTGKP